MFTYVYLKTHYYGLDCIPPNLYVDILPVSQSLTIKHYLENSTSVPITSIKP